MDVCGPMPALPLGTKMATGDDAKPATPASAPRAQGPQTPEVAGLSDRKLKANPKKSHDRKPLKSPKDAMQESQDSVPDPKKSMQEAHNPEKSVQESNNPEKSQEGNNPQKSQEGNNPEKSQEGNNPEKSQDLKPKVHEFGDGVSDMSQATQQSSVCSMPANTGQAKMNRAWIATEFLAA